MTLLNQLFSSKVRSEMLRLLYSEPLADLHLRELARRSGLALRTIQTDLAKLSDLGLVIARRDGNRLQFRANTAHPLFPELKSIVQKTSGLIPALKDRLGPLEEKGKIRCAFVFGSMATSESKAHSDVDLMVIGELGLRELVKALSGLADQIGREVNPHLLSAKSYKERIGRKDHFLTQVAGRPKTFIVGDENELEELG